MERIKQLVLAFKTNEGLINLINKLNNNGFQILHGLNDINSLKHKIIGTCVDLDDKVVFQLGVTSMACWCGGYRKPIYAEEVLVNYEQFISKRDSSFYEELIKSASMDKNRPYGCLCKAENASDALAIIKKLRKNN